MTGTELSLTTLWVLSLLITICWSVKFSKLIGSYKGEAVVDLSALEYGPLHQLDLALTPAEDPFLAKKVSLGGVGS